MYESNIRYDRNFDDVHDTILPEVNAGICIASEPAK